MARARAKGERRRGKLTARRAEAIAVQKEILAGIRERVVDLIGHHTPEFAAYSKEYEEQFREYQGVATKDEIVAEARRSDIVYCGDYHTLEQAQKTCVKILREVVPGRKVVLALEMIRAKDQLHVDAYMAGRLGEEEFLRAIDYPQSWGFPWANYKLLFDFARKHDLRVVGLNYRPTRARASKLVQRDAFAAQILARLLDQGEGELVWVLYGDLHVAPPHIPARVDELLAKLGTPRRSMIVFQNNKRLWFRLAEQGLVPGYDAVRLGPGRYCVLNTPPWIKLQTYLDHLEQRVFSTPEEEDDAPAYEDNVAQLITELGRLIGVPEAPVDDFQLYTPDDLDALLSKARSLGGVRLLRLLVESARSLYFPEGRILFLSEIDSNHAAEAAAEYLHHVCSGYSLKGRDARDLFYLRCLRKCFGFFGSMLLNPKRKTDYFKDHDLFLQRWYRKRLPPARERQRRVSRLVVQHQRAVEQVLRSGRGRPRLRKIYEEDPELGYGVSRALGSIMGDKLYRAFMDGLLEKEELVFLFCDPQRGPNRALDTYLTLRRRLKAVKKPFKSKDEFF